MSKILSKLHYFIILWVFYGAYNSYEEHLQALEILNAQIPTIEQFILKAKKQKKEIKNYNQDIIEAKLRIEKVADEIEKLQKQLPTNISVTDNLDLLNNLATNLNLKNIALAPDVEEERGFYISQKYKFKADGTYLQFLIFLEKISVQERILNIYKISFNKNSVKQKGRFQIISGEIVIETFKHNPNFKEERGIDAIEKQFKNSGDPPA